MNIILLLGLILTIYPPTLTITVIHHPHKSFPQYQGDEITELLSHLTPVEIRIGSKTTIQGPTQQLQEAVRQRLVEIANESEQSRDKVVHALIQVVDDPEAKGESLIAHRWLIAVSVLRELKATEAIDVLIKNIFVQDKK